MSGASCCALLCNVDEGIGAPMMQASGPRRCRHLEPKCLPLGSSIDTGVLPYILALALTLELTFPLDN